MKRLKKIVAAAVIGMVAVSVMGCKMIEKTPEAIQQTVYAEVGNEKITKADLDNELKSTVESIKQKYGEDYENNAQIKDQLKQMKQQALNAMVNEKLMIQQADSLGVNPSEDDLNSEVDKNIQTLKSQYPQEGQFEQLLQANGYTEDSFRDYKKKQVLVKKVYDEIVKDVTVSDDDIKSYYDENKDSKYSQGAGANASHILIAEKNADGSSIDYDKSLEKAKEIKAKLDAGGDFAQLAKDNSTDGSKDSGGSLGFVAYDKANYDKDFLAAFKNLKEGQISDPVKTQFGYHIIKATGLKGAQVTPLDEVKDDIKSELLQQKQSDAFNAKINEWKQSVKVKTYEDRL